MDSALVAAISAVLVAAIAAFASAFTARDSRKKALDEAELLEKLQQSLGADATPVTDIRTVLERRTNEWKENSEFALFGSTLRFMGIAWAVAVASSLAAAAISGNDPRAGVVQTLGIIESLATLFIAAATLAVVLGIGAALFTGVRSTWRWLKHRKAKSRPSSADQHDKDQAASPLTASANDASLSSRSAADPVRSKA